MWRLMLLVIPLVAIKLLVGNPSTDFVPGPGPIPTNIPFPTSQVVISAETEIARQKTEIARMPTSQPLVLTHTPTPRPIQQQRR